MQAGEVRVCASCHGINTADQAGNPPPSNEPQALRKLLGQARTPGAAAIEDALRAIESADHAVKTGELADELALELLVIRLGELLGNRRDAGRAPARGAR